MTVKIINELDINQLTIAKYQELVASGDINEDGFYLVTDEMIGDEPVTGYVKAEAQAAIAAIDTVNQAFGKLEKKADDNISNIGTQTYTEQNYIADAEPLTTSIDKLDMQAKDTADIVSTNMDVALTNLVTNGDFSSGTTGLVATNSSISVSNNELTMLATTANGQVVMPEANFIIGNKYYIGAMVKSTTANAQLSAAGATGSLRYHSGSGNYEKLSLVWDSTLDAALKLRLRDTRASGFDNIFMKCVFAINLTAPFGLGNEPTAAEMDTLVSLVPNNWWGGTLKPSQKLLLNWQLKMIRANTAAIAAL